MEKAVKSGSPAVRYLEIDESRAGQRLDNFLIAILKGVPRSHIYRILRKGEVRINKGRARPDYRLEPGDVVRIPPLRVSPAKDLDPQKAADGFGWLLPRILHEDDDLMVVNKPAGLAVHGGSGVSVGLIEALRGLRPETPALELAHRLDRDTSGCLLLAKTRPTMLALHRMLREGKMEKHYLALVSGVWRGGTREGVGSAGKEPAARRRTHGGGLRGWQGVREPVHSASALRFRHAHGDPTAHRPHPPGARARRAPWASDRRRRQIR